MNEYFDDLRALGASPVNDIDQAGSVLDLYNDVISSEIGNLDDKSKELVCTDFVQSQAYQWDVKNSRKRLIEWLSLVDVLESNVLEFIATVILIDIRSIYELASSYNGLRKVIESIWTYRFTQSNIVHKYMRILYNICTSTQLGVKELGDVISEHFVKFLFRVINEEEQYIMLEESMYLLLALNIQYITAGLNDKNNKVFDILASDPSNNFQFTSALVLFFNRFNEHEDKLKSAALRLLQMIFETPSTKELFYTNDLIVLLDLVVRDFNEIPLIESDLRIKFLHVLLMIMQYPGTLNDQTANKVITVLSSAVDPMDASENQKIINNLAERCIYLANSHSLLGSASSSRSGSVTTVSSLQKEDDEKQNNPDNQAEMNINDLLTLKVSEDVSNNNNATTSEIPIQTKNTAPQLDIPNNKIQGDTTISQNKISRAHHVPPPPPRGSRAATTKPQTNSVHPNRGPAPSIPARPPNPHTQNNVTNSAVKLAANNNTADAITPRFKDSMQPRVYNNQQFQSPVTMSNISTTSRLGASRPPPPPPRKCMSERPCL
ncbi:hypothetical protein DASB73_013850 [Starmerella bacillaris]|uniref:SPIN90/Ldb17 leucine-rich domain-containing protein n=1 Tax=Starmerella bacillaris TaxID=1247836 RepID=A0AAV5RH56_STABA|nr:hypothetical protein DASB73_013850 [Starmerella bacillaris]